MRRIEGNLTGTKAYRALLGLAFEHKGYFALAVLGMVIFAASDAAFAYMIKPLMDDGFTNRDADVIRYIPVAIILIFVVRMVAVFMRGYCMSFIGRSVINSLRNQMFDKLLTLTSDEYDQLRESVIEQDRSLPTVQKQFREVAHMHNPPEIDPLKQIRSTLSTARRLESQLEELAQLAPQHLHSLLETMKELAQFEAQLSNAAEDERSDESSS